MIKKLSVVFILGIVAVQVFSIVSRHDSWPLSSYPMFSGTKAVSEVSNLRVVAVLQDGTENFLFMGSSKGVWAAYAMRTLRKDWVGLEQRILRDLKTHHANLPLENIRELKLVRVSFAEAAQGATPTMKQETVHTFSMNRFRTAAL